jgi:membrane associated rhomboid family serine protease
MIPASVGFQCPECVAEGRRTTRAARTAYGGRLPLAGRHGQVTRVLIAVNVVVFLVTVTSGASVLTGTGTSSIYNRFALVPVAVAHGQWYRLITATFLHYGIFHIAFNMWALWVVGPLLEAALGRWRYVVLYALSGIGGGLLSVLSGPINEQAAGASGAIFGLFGGLYVIARHRNLPTGGIAATIVVNLIFTFSVSNIDWRGHVGGLVIGTLIAAIYAFTPRGARRTHTQVAAVALVAVVMSVVGFAAAHHVRHECPTLLTTSNGQVGCPSLVIVPGT